MQILVKVATVILNRANPPLAQMDNPLDVPEGTDVHKIIEMVGLPDDLVWSVVVNGRRAPKTYVVKENDTVILIPAVTGG